MRCFGVVAALVVTVPSALVGQRMVTAPDTVAAHFLQAVADEQWRVAVGYFDLALFDAFRRDLLADERQRRARPVVTARTIQRADPAMPLAVAQYHARQAHANRRGYSPVGAAFGDSVTADMLERWSVEEAAVRWLQHEDPRVQARRAVAAMIAQVKARCGTVPAGLEQVTAPTDEMMPRRIVGTVADDSVAWVIHKPARALAEGSRPAAEAPAWDTPDEPAMVHLRLVGGAWRIVGRPRMIADADYSFGVSGLACSSERADTPSRARRP